MKHTPAVVIGSGYGGGTALSVIRSLGRRGVPLTYLCSDANSLAAASRYARTVRVAKLSEAPDAYLESLLAAGGPERPVLLAVSDGEVRFLARNRNRLAERFRLQSMPSDRLEALQDKMHQWRVAADAGLAVPRTLLVDEGAIPTVAASFEFPVFAKPRLSYQRTGLQKGEFFSTREEWLRRAPALLASQTAHLVQEVIPGASEALYQVSIYRDAGGHMLANSVTRKIRDYPRRFGIGTLVETVDAAELAAHAGRFLAAAEYSGIANVEFKFDTRTSRHTFLEINTRYFFPHELSVRAGVDFPWIHYRDLLDQPPDAPPVQQAGMRWTSFGLDLRASLESMREGELGVGEWLGSFRGVRSEAFFALDDLRPFLRYLAGLVRLPLPAAKTERSAHVSRPVAPAR